MPSPPNCLTGRHRPPPKLDRDGWHLIVEAARVVLQHGDVGGDDYMTLHRLYYVSRVDALISRDLTQETLAVLRRHGIEFSAKGFAYVTGTGAVLVGYKDAAEAYDAQRTSHAVLHHATPETQAFEDRLNSENDTLERTGLFDDLKRFVSEEYPFTSY